MFSVKVDSEKGEWSIVEKSVVDAKYVDCWAFVDFTEGEPSNELYPKAFLKNLMRQSSKLGIKMSVPSSYKRTGMQNLSSLDRVKEVITPIVQFAVIAGKKLQLILCAVSRTDAEYKYINWVLGNVFCFGEKIVIFRSGGSQTELEKEMLDLSTAFSSYRPQITLVVANKLHKLQANHVQLGAVLDTGFSHPGRARFYLWSQPGDGGNPTHYSVFLDDNNFTSDELKRLIYDMCFTYQSQTKPLPIVPPIFYARLAASRGQLYQEVAAENDLRPKTMPHFDLMDGMFFL